MLNTISEVITVKIIRNMLLIGWEEPLENNYELRVS